MTKTSPQSEELDNASEAIERAKKAGVDDWRIKQMYVELVNQAIKSIQLNSEIKGQ